MSQIICVGILSDTHVPSRVEQLPDSALRHFVGVDRILHAGDLSRLAVLDQLATYAPVDAVQGNVEWQEVVDALPIKRELLIGGVAVGMVHILDERPTYARSARREFATARVVTIGHSHSPYVGETGDLLLVNPGSATDRRRQPRCTIALLTIEEGVPRAELVPIEPPTA